MQQYATVTDPRHPLHGKVVLLGGSSNVYKGIQRIPVQDVRYENRWYRVEKQYLSA